MFCFDSPVSTDHHINMAKSLNSTDPCSKMKQINQSNKSKRTIDHLNIPACEQYPYAIIDVIISIAVICACGVLIYPFVSIVAHTTLELGKEAIDVVIEEIVQAPMLFGCLGFSILLISMALVAIIVCTENRCGKQGCRGLRNAAEFDMHLETEESEKKSDNESKKGLFELRPDHHKELEAKLKKIAPPNGRAVMVFKARCGCSVGRMEVPGPRKYRKVKN